MTGPTDETRHGTLRISDDGVQTHVPKPADKLTAAQRHTVEELRAIERWQTDLYATRSRPRMSRRRSRGEA